MRFPSIFQKQRAATILMIILMAVGMGLRVFATHFNEPLGDELPDFLLTQDDRSKFFIFFTGADEVHQARLPLYLGAIFTRLITPNAAARDFFSTLIPLRLFSLGFHLPYLLVSYKLILKVCRQRAPAVLYFIFLLTSCYLSGFSIFTATTSENVYLLFHIMSIYYFYKIFSESRTTGFFSNWVFLAVLIGLCTASKLFGVFLLISFCLFHFISVPRGMPIRVSPDPKFLIAGGTVFFVLLFLLQLIPLSLMVKTITAVAIGFLYLILLLIVMLKTAIGTPAETRANFYAVWIAIALTAGAVTFIFSPIYLNLENVRRIFDWWSGPNQSTITLRHQWYDLPVMLFFKFGLVSAGAACAAGFFWILRRTRKNRAPFKGSFTLLVIFVFTVHFSLLMFSRLLLPMYPLAIFPFFYLPFVGLWLIADQGGGRKLKIAAIVCVLLAATDNGVRYLKWYPYAHYYGAQFGKAFIGPDKAGFVNVMQTIPSLYKTLGGLPSDSPHHVNVRVHYAVPYNHLVRILAQEFFSKYQKEKGLFRFDVKPLNEDPDSDYILTSPLYSPELENDIKLSGKFLRKDILSIKGIEILTVWERVLSEKS